MKLFAIYFSEAVCLLIDYLYNDLRNAGVIIMLSLLAVLLDELIFKQIKRKNDKFKKH
jgi:hypothetical protein